jgi:hypothetical protein
MASIDVSFVLDDPQFADQFQVLRNQQIVDQHGRTQVAGSASPVITGVVQPGSGATLRLLPDLANVAAALEIWTRFRLQTASDTTEADVVVWKNRSYRVVALQDFTNYGGGYVHAVCEMIEVKQPAPARNVVDYG